GHRRHHYPGGPEEAMMRMKWMLVAAAFLLPMAAVAQDGEGTVGETTDTEPIDIDPRDLGERPGIRVQAQGGVQSYVGQAGDAVRPGGAYGVLVGLPTSGFLGLELGYQGSAFETQDRANGIVENGGQALVKLNPHFGRWEPYVYGGVGATRLTVLGDNPLVDNDTLVKVPVGAGVDVRFPRDSENAFLVGGRAGYNYVYDNEAFTTAPANTGQLNLTLQVGGRF
ncbi:MAG: outer membrane protein, partial [Myxococcales bacterium]